jgi:hypothetical protein
LQEASEAFHCQLTQGVCRNQRDAVKRKRERNEWQRKIGFQLRLTRGYAVVICRELANKNWNLADEVNENDVQRNQQGLSQEEHSAEMGCKASSTIRNNEIFSIV